MGRDSVKKVEGYGAALRARLRSVGMTQGRLASAASLSRQTISRALTRDEVSSRTSQLIDEVLGREVVQTAPSAIEVSRVRRGASQTWVTATDLVDWSARRTAQEDLPQLIRKLILVTCDNVRSISFRAGEGVQLPGWDGRVTTAGGNAFVPEGISGWELGTSSDPRAKAQAVFTARLEAVSEEERRSITFVFVSSRRWPGKDEWVSARRAEGGFKDVRVLDADDLETWLELAPSVHAWLSGKLGTLPEHTRDLATWWQEWSDSTRPPLDGSVLLAGREVTRDAILKSLAGTQTFAVRAESRVEAIALLAASMKTMSDAEAEGALARAVVVESSAAWRRLCASRARLILIPTFDAIEVLASASRAGHSVIIPLGENDPDFDSVITTPPISKRQVAQALEALGQDKDVAEDLARVARRSFTVFRRRIAVAPSLQRPAWALPAQARTVLPVFFAGAWNEVREGDNGVLSHLSRRTYDEFVDEIARWKVEADSFVRQRGRIWYLVSREDAWDLLERFIRHDDIERFETVAIEALSTVDPRYDLEVEKRWAADLYEKRHPLSANLISGLAKTVALLGVKSDAMSVGEPKPYAATARSVVGEVLRRANGDWRLWASLSDILRDLAEAAPDAFLARVEEGLRVDQSPIAKVFEAEGDSLFGGAPHTGLLWALERVAWSSDHLGRVVQILAELDRRDPGGRLTNRPRASLEAIFRPWLPQTSATADRRFEVLRAAENRYSEQVWGIMVSMLPEFHGVANYSARPEWRDWAKDWERRVKGTEYTAAIEGTVRRLIALAGVSGSRWAALVEAYPNLLSVHRQIVLEALRALNPEGMAEPDRAVIWDAMRDLVARHREFPDAKWALEAAAVDQIDELRVRFQPRDSVAASAWLFTHNATLPDATAPRGDFDAQHDELHLARRAAVRAIAAVSGEEGLVTIARTAEVPHAVGWAAADELVVDDEVGFLVRYLAHEERLLDEMARGYVAGRSRDATWLDTELPELRERLASVQLGALLWSALPVERSTWELVSTFGNDVERAYWKQLWHVRNDEDVEYAAGKLLSFGRVARAVDVLGMHARAQFNPELALEALERLLEGGDPEMGNNIRSNLGYHIERLLDSLVAAPQANHPRLAALEWGYLPVFDRRDRSPKTLHKAMADDPSFFVEVVSLAFRAETDRNDEHPTPTPDQRAHAERAYTLLQSWRTLPGQNGQVVDAQQLTAWVRQARQSLQEAQRLEIGDQQIGGMLSGSPADSDGSWPCEAVRTVLEAEASEDIETGIVHGVYNSRGAVWRGSGGAEERAMADRYDGFATSVAGTSPRTASMLRRMAKNYREDAHREDTRAALEEELE